MKTKQCIDCGSKKPHDQFHKRSSSKDGLQSRCKPCNIARASGEFYKNKEKRIAYQREWDSQNKHKNRISSIMRNYGVDRTEAERLESIEECEICGKTLSNKRHRHIDHDHKDGYVRGVLCNKCNLGLGLFLDRPELLQAAAEYLIKPRKH